MFVHSSNGFAGIPVGCFTGSDCSVSLRIRMKGAIVGQSSTTHLTGGTGALVYVPLSSSARNALAQSSNHRVLLEVTARGASGISTTTYLTAIPYSTSGSGPLTPCLPVPGSPGGQYHRVRPTQGSGSLLAGCYAEVPCELKATLSAGGQVIARTSAEHLGVAEVGPISFELSSTGQSMLANASGNQLATQVSLTNGSSTRHRPDRPGPTTADDWNRQVDQPGSAARRVSRRGRARRQPEPALRVPPATDRMAAPAARPWP